ncbi:uncharacterized protein G2W53_012510 [Senna tora]|uniref:Uncharacterized protein n=1 Tax=Senna tora TaxID=362788 RepID=A0A834TXR7_9FABA|nr:uncharacterized protein G2W53_012510 [Senna tora]
MELMGIIGRNPLDVRGLTLTAADRYLPS